MPKTSIFQSDEHLPTETERRILSIVHRHGEIARSDLFKQSNLSQTSIHRLVDSLVDRGFIALSEGEVRGRGKPSPKVALNRDAKASAGLSFTSDSVRVSVLNLVGERLLDAHLQVSPNDPEAVIKAVQTQIHDIHSEFPTRQLIGVGIGMQGFRTGTDDEFRTPDSLSAWRHKPLRKLFANVLPCAISVENNATAAAIAEQLVGGGLNTNCLAYLSFNLGFGGGFVWNRKAVFGGHGNAGELTLMFPKQERQHRPALGELLERLQSQGIDISDLNELAEKFDPDWPGVAEWLQEITPSLQQVVRSLKAILDPNVIFFGGEAPDALRSLLIERANLYTDADDSPRPDLLPSRITGDCSHIGAALLPIHQLVLDGEVE